MGGFWGVLSIKIPILNLYGDNIKTVKERSNKRPNKEGLHVRSQKFTKKVTLRHSPFETNR